jgi:hypothetical protein
MLLGQFDTMPSNGLRRIIVTRYICSFCVCLLMVVVLLPDLAFAQGGKLWYGRIQIIQRRDGTYKGECGSKSRFEGSVQYDEHFVGVADVGVCGGGMHLGAYNIFSNANYSRNDSYRVEEKKTQCTDNRLKHLRWATPGDRKEQHRQYAIGTIDRSSASCMVNLIRAPGGAAKLMVVLKSMDYEQLCTGYDSDHRMCVADKPRRTPVNARGKVPWIVGFAIDVNEQGGMIQGKKDIMLAKQDARTRAINRREIDKDVPSNYLDIVHVNYCFWQESLCDRIQDEFWEDLALCRAYGNKALVSTAHSNNWSLQQYRDAVRQEAIAFKNKSNPKQKMACEALFQNINPGSNMPVSSGDMSYSVSDDMIHNIDGSSKRISQKCMDPVRHQSILRHEEEHRKQANDPANAMPATPTIDSLHAFEPPAYAAGLEVLLDWMKKNCPAAYPKMSSAYRQVTGP